MCRNFIHRYYTKSEGFTLVELSIVIVIIGLIVAGVTAGQSLVRQAKLKTISTNKDNYFTAIRSFELAYAGLPGDITNARAWWPSLSYSGGDGDRKIIGQSEGVQAWQQLQLAKLISNGNYDGVFINAEVPGVTVGTAGFSKDTGFLLFAFGINLNWWGYSNAAVYGQYYPVVMGFGKVSTADAYTVPYAALLPAEAYAIDSKFDDGIPNKGAILGDNGYDTGVSTCTNAGTSSASAVAAGASVSYLTVPTTVGCRLMFVYKK
jgi:prepilin-type N-terminal cleavage/methylation domain-containing protein